MKYDEIVSPRSGHARISGGLQRRCIYKIITFPGMSAAGKSSNFKSDFRSNSVSTNIT